MKECLISGDKRRMIKTPIGYMGKTYIGGRYVYEHRFLMEQKLGRLLNKNEIVHHKDGDKNNNNIDNLELSDNIKHAKHHAKKITYIEVICTCCKKKILRSKRDIFKKKWAGLKNSFCSNSCQQNYQKSIRS